LTRDSTPISFFPFYRTACPLACRDGERGSLLLFSFFSASADICDRLADALCPMQNAALWPSFRRDRTPLLIHGRFCLSSSGESLPRACLVAMLPFVYEPLVPFVAWCSTRPLSVTFSFVLLSVPLTGSVTRHLTHSGEKAIARGFQVVAPPFSLSLESFAAVGFFVKETDSAFDSRS